MREFCSINQIQMWTRGSKNAKILWKSFWKLSLQSLRMRCLQHFFDFWGKRQSPDIPGARRASRIRGARALLSREDSREDSAFWKMFHRQSPHPTESSMGRRRELEEGDRGGRAGLAGGGGGGVKALSSFINCRVRARDSVSQSGERT